jgi:putative sterol carrier protein
MTFEECIGRFGKIAACTTIEGVDDAYIQVDIVGRDSNKFYIHIKNGVMDEVTIGEYKERDVLWIVNLGMLEKIINGVMDPIYAYTTGKFNMKGDVALGRKVLTCIRK